MDVESSLVPQQKRKPITRDYVPGALAFGVPTFVLLVLVLVGDSVFGATVRSWPVVGALWSVLYFFLVLVCGAVLVPCLVIIGLRLLSLWKDHKQQIAAYKQQEDTHKQQIAVYRKESALKDRELLLLDEKIEAARLANLAAQRAMVEGDNFTITSSRDSVSTQVIRGALLLEQARIQHAGRVQKQVETDGRIQIASPAASSGNGSQNGKTAGSAAPSDPNKKYHPPVDTGGILSFAELIAAGLVLDAAREGFILRGYVGGLLHYGTWLDLYSCGVGGVSGSGKTTTVRFLLFQGILIGGRLLMVDPAIHEPSESLAAQFAAFGKRIHVMPPCDDNSEQVTKRIRWLWNEYLRRKKHGIKGPAIIFVIDEFNEVVALLPTEVKKELAELLLRISQSGRKFGLFAMLIGQRWSEQDLGGRGYGAAIRSSLAALLAHRFTDPQQASKLVTSSKVEECTGLQEGHFFFRDTHGGCDYTITPYTASEDGAAIELLLAELENTLENTTPWAENTAVTVISKETGPLPRARTTVNEVESSLVPAENTTGQAENTDIYTLARRVMSLHAEGKTIADVMRAVWGANPGESDAYKQAKQEYQRVMQFIAEYLSGL